MQVLPNAFSLKETVDNNGKITYKKDTLAGIIHTTVNSPGSGKMEMTHGCFYPPPKSSPARGEDLFFE